MTKDDPFWFLDTRRLPMPLQWAVLFSLLPSIWVCSYLPDHQRELSEAMRSFPWTFSTFIRVCEMISATAITATILHGQLTRGRERREQERKSSGDDR